jgi:beta-N-acetylhexosaminidase
MGAVSSPFGQQQQHAAVTALLAGADVVCLGSVDQERATESAANAILKALADETLDPAVLVATAERRAQLITRPREIHEHANVQLDQSLLANAAQRSLLTQGDATLTGPRVDVLRIGALPSFVGRHLTGFGLDVQLVDTVAACSDRDLVIEVRDAWRSADLLQFLADAVRARPEAIIIDVGMPTPGLPMCRGILTTHGVGNLSMALAACHLTRRDPRPYVLAILEGARVLT